MELCPKCQTELTETTLGFGSPNDGIDAAKSKGCLNCGYYDGNLEMIEDW